MPTPPFQREKSRRQTSTSRVGRRYQATKFRFIPEVTRANKQIARIASFPTSYIAITFAGRFCFCLDLFCSNTSVLLLSERGIYDSHISICLAHGCES